MQLTDILKLKKPGYDDPVDIAVWNENMELVEKGYITLEEAIENVVGEPYHVGFEPPEDKNMFWIDLNDWEDDDSKAILELLNFKADKTEVDSLKQFGVGLNEVLVDALNSKRIPASVDDTIKINVDKVNDIKTGVEVPLKRVSNLIALFSENSIELNWASPKDIICEGVTITEFKHDIVVRSSENVPNDINDGVQVVVGGRDEFKITPFTDSDIEEGKKYYYRVFSVSEDGTVTGGNGVAMYAAEIISLKDLPVESVVKSQGATIYGNSIEWMKLEDNHYDMNETTLISKDIITYKCIDAKEPRNPNSERSRYGNNRYIYSNIHQWLNSDKVSWYEDAHPADQAPNYMSVFGGYNQYFNKPGFMNSWDNSFKDAILDTRLEVARAIEDGEGNDSFNAKVFCLSRTEVGLGNVGSPEGAPFTHFNSDNKRKAVPMADADANNENSTPSVIWWLRTPSTNSVEYGYRVNSRGTLDWNRVYSGTDGIRPALNLPSSTKVNKKPNSDGSYNLLI